MYYLPISMQHPAIGHDDAKSAVTFREIRKIPMNAAWRAVRDGKPVSELMALESERLNKIRIQPGTIALAQRWQAQMEAAVMSQ